jgi:DNA-binding GntR family transcriptional regulator
MPDVADGATKLRFKAYDRFTKRLLAREIRAGQFVSQRELVELTGMPLGAIRELIPRLEAEGLIATAPQRGLQIAHVDLDLIRDAFQFRLFLEREAAAFCAERADDAQIAAWRRAHETIIERARKEPVGPGLIAEAQAVDNGFHESVVDAVGNAILSKTYRVNAIKIRLIRQSRTRLDADLVVPVMQEHLRMIEALESREPTEASEAFAVHILNARNRALGVP